MDRRSFLAGAAGVLGMTLLSGKLWAIPSAGGASNARFLVVMLRGAYDGASLLVPHGYPFYYAARPNIAIPRPNPANPMSASDIGDGYGLHPAVASSLYTLYQQRQAVLVPFSGSQDLSRSHFEAQDVMELGLDPRQRLSYGSGFLNRLVGVLRKNNRRAGAMSFTDNLPLVFKGDVEVPNISLKAEVRDLANQRQAKMLAELYQHKKLGDYVEQGIETRREVSADLEQEMKDASRGAAKASGFERQARSIAALMRDNPSYSIGFVDVGGWDTHVNQGGAAGQLANNLGNLANGLYGFADELGEAGWRDTVVVVMSEFGRTFRENGNRGTDHGHGNVLWVLGGGLSGGKLAGELTDVSEASLFQNRDFPLLNDYRSVLGHLVQRMFGLDVSSLNTVFPGAAARDYGIL
jgi:uncharacterized protein (DUF1501 family)